MEDNLNTLVNRRRPQRQHLHQLNQACFQTCLPGWSVSYTNPIIDSNNPDPAVLALPTGGYIAVATSNHATDPSSEDVFPIYTSEDLINWELEGDTQKTLSNTSASGC